MNFFEDYECLFDYVMYLTSLTKNIQNFLPQRECIFYLFFHLKE